MRSASDKTKLREERVQKLKSLNREVELALTHVANAITNAKHCLFDSGDLAVAQDRLTVAHIQVTSLIEYHSNLIGD